MLWSILWRSRERDREKDRELEETGWKRPAHRKEAIRGGKIRLEWGTDGLIKERKIPSKIQSGWLDVEVDPVKNIIIKSSSTDYLLKKGNWLW